MTGQAHITITYHGLTGTIREWSDFLSVDYYTLAARIRRGWSNERVLETPLRHRGAGPRTHGQSGSKEYVAWKAMIQRCSSLKYHGSHRYLGRGLTVCQRWREHFSTFLADVRPCPSPHMSLGRIDNTRGYEVGNCRWETPQQQANNRARPNRTRNT
ncbi:MAG: hypothetical protein ABSF26_25265 [Thermoguttaceae bacterium]|jgi:hypothetical protein